MNVVDALAFVLPPPLTPTDVTSLSADYLGLIPDDQATVMLGRNYPRSKSHLRSWYRDAQRLARSYAECYSFVAIPGRVLHPRALTPIRGNAEAHRLLMPRVELDSIVGRICAKVVASTPGSFLRRLGEQVLIGTHEPSPIVTLLRRIVPNARIGCFIGNELNMGRSTVFGFDGERNHLIAIAKVVTEPDGKDRVLTEARMLRALSLRKQLNGTVPRLLGLPEFHLGRSLVTDAFEGGPCPTHLTPQLYSWLELCTLSDSVPVLASEVVSRSLLGMDGINLDLRSVLEDAKAVLDGVQVPRTIVHGDFAPWNILVRRGEACVFDWEFGSLNGIPEWDRAFFVAQTGIISLGWDSITVADRLNDIVCAGSAHYNSPDQHRAVLVLMLADLAARYARGGQADLASFTERAARLIASPLRF